MGDCVVGVICFHRILVPLAGKYTFGSRAFESKSDTPNPRKEIDKC